MSNHPELLVQQLKVLADLTRMRLIALCRHGECSVSELTEVTGQSQPRISQHLRALCEAALLTRHRDGKRVYYRVPLRGDDLELQSKLLALIPEEDRLFADDMDRLREIRGEQLESETPVRADVDADRAVFRAIIDLTVTAPIGAVLDIGCGRGQILKLLASRSNRAVGLDIDAKARRLARAELMLAGVPNCTLRQGDMYRLPFDDEEFDTIILDDVLGDARNPVKALKEARRLLKPGGRMLLLMSLRSRGSEEAKQLLAEWSAACGLRLSPARIATAKNPIWMLAVATRVVTKSEAA